MQCSSDILIVGSGVIGLAIALELTLKGQSVALLCRDFAEGATHAAAGMLAPQAEGLTPGPMLELCLRSRSSYPSWINQVEEISGLSAGYWPCGILAPVYNRADLNHPSEQWLDRSGIDLRQPGLGESVCGGWWFPDDAQVDNRALARSLWQAVTCLGVAIHTGVTVQKLVHSGDRITHIITDAGSWQAQHYVLATGAWFQELLPVPVLPRKGQMLALRSTTTSSMLLQTVLFGSEIYIVPRKDGRIVVGATNEDVGFQAGNTPMGMQKLMSAATRLVPSLNDATIEEFWYGFRPATPDELPILGPSAYENLTLATGHYRNGILLTPITARLVADWIVDRSIDPLLPHFYYSRFNPI